MVAYIRGRFLRSLVGYVRNGDGCGVKGRVFESNLCEFVKSFIGEMEKDGD